MIDIKTKFLDSKIKEFTLENSCGFKVKILNLGGIITKIYTNDINGKLVNVVLGYEDYTKYIDNGSYAGAIIGPTSGRIENGIYFIDNIKYELEINNGKNANHGGKKGLSHMIFEDEIKDNKLILKYNWKHLQGNHCGNMNFEIIYEITEKNELKIDLKANSDRNSYINLTNHSYFNLAGNLDINGDEQLIRINADQYCPVNENMIPTGLKKDVSNSIFDLRNFTKIKDNILKGDIQFNITRAYDHAFILNKNMKPALTLYSDYSKIALDIETSQNCMVMYSGNYLDDVIVFDGENSYKNKRYLGIALEAQNYQNGINIKDFDFEIINPNNLYHQSIKYIFYIKEDLE